MTSVHQLADVHVQMSTTKMIVHHYQIASGQEVLVRQQSAHP
mgnify:CR=1 FL=1